MLEAVVTGSYLTSHACTFLAITLSPSLPCVAGENMFQSVKNPKELFSTMLTFTFLESIN